MVNEAPAQLYTIAEALSRAAYGLYRGHARGFRTTQSIDPVDFKDGVDISTEEN